MTLQARLNKLVKLLKNDEDFIVYKKTISRLRFDILRIWQVDIKGNSEPHFCMLMANGEVQYLELCDLTIDELESIVEDLENMLING